MAKTELITCDRCGATTDSYRSKEWSYIHRYPSGYDEGSRVDLCPNCYNLLGQFLACHPARG